MNFKPILIIPGEQKSIFFEIFFKSINSQKVISPLILICNKKNLYNNVKRYKFKKRIKELSINEIYEKKFQNRKIYLINISNKYPKFYVKKCFETAFATVPAPAAAGESIAIFIIFFLLIIIFNIINYF